jgi:uncharacterized phiE125 gp8 family phage protein
MNYSATTAPTVEPVSLTQAKLWCRIDGTTDDSLIAGLISAARDYCQQYEGRAYTEQTITAYTDNFKSIISLPMPPVISVTSVKYRDEDDVWQTLSTDYYTLRNDIEPAYIEFDLTGLSYTLAGEPNQIEIIYKAGYVTSFEAATSDTLTVGRAIFADGDTVVVDTDQSDLPAPLAIATTYYVRDVSGSTLKLATSSGGTAVDITDTGTGTHYIGKSAVPARVKAAISLLVSHWYEHRLAACEAQLNQIPIGVNSLLSERVWVNAQD